MVLDGYIVELMLGEGEMDTFAPRLGLLMFFPTRILHFNANVFKGVVLVCYKNHMVNTNTNWRACVFKLKRSESIEQAKLGQL